MKKQLLALITFLPLTGIALKAQSAWTLQECITHALQHNPEVVQAGITREQTLNNFQQSKWNQWPDLSLNSGQFLQNGRSIDRFTNTFTQTRIFSNNVGLQSNALLYAGGQLRHNVQQLRYTYLASTEDEKVVNNNISLRVANLYLQALQAKELLQAAVENKNSIAAQLDRAQKLLQAGAVAESQVLTLQAQLSAEQVNLVVATNQVEQALTGLRTLLLLPFGVDFDVIAPNLPVGKEKPEDYQPDSIFQIAQQNRPEVASAHNKVLSAEFGLKGAYSGRYPTLNAGFNLNTLYSQNAKRITGTTISGTRPIGFVTGTNEIVETVDFAYTLQTIPFNKQFRDNLGQSAGLQISWSIFGKRNVDTRIQQAKLSLQSAQLQETAVRYQLYSEIITAYTGFRQAYLRYAANADALEFQNLNLNNVERRFASGQANSTELQVARSSRFNAASNLIQSKYERIFRRMILDFYSGTPIQLNY
ncbi:MAG: TolC family protein [Bacteroidetes bacterium]|nr:TolC family protein [Bacteroidota bacterium]